eukprot:Seg1450.3 transcript_id=Seg1450.3/GoldUCD/mRNA.D3Y31 product="hypothetical protein" protein_id=Seg1450.3/GoldUCD/D3Y31
MGDIFISWDENHNGFVNFVYNNIITRNDAAQTKLQIFVNPSLKEHDKPNFAPWICEHECLTSARGATEASLIAYLMNNYIKSGANIRKHDSNSDVSLDNKVQKRKSIFLVQTKPGQHEELFSILANMKDFVINYDLRLLRLQDEPRADSSASAYNKRDEILAGQRPSFEESTNPSLYYETTRKRDKASWQGDVGNGHDFGPGRRTEHQNGHAHGRFRTTSSNITAHSAFPTTRNDSTPHKLPPQRQHQNDFPMLHESVCENCRKHHGNGRYEDDFLESAKLRRSWPSTGHGRQRQVEVMHICEICMSRYYREKAQIASKWPARPRTPLTMESKHNVNEQQLDQFEQYCPSCNMVAPIDDAFDDSRGQAYAVRKLHEPKDLKLLQNGSVKCSCLDSDSRYICSDCFIKKIVGRTDVDGAKAKTQNMVKDENGRFIGKFGMVRNGRMGSAPAKFRSYPNDSETTRVNTDVILPEKRKDGEVERFVERIVYEGSSIEVKARSSLENDGGKEGKRESSEESRFNSGSSLEARGKHETRSANSSDQSFNYKDEENQEFLFREKSNSEDNTKIGFGMGREEDEGYAGISDNAEEHKRGSSANEANDIESNGSFNTTLDDLLAKLGSDRGNANEVSDNEANTGNEDQRVADEQLNFSQATSPIQERTQSPEIYAEMMRVSLNDTDQNGGSDFANMFPLTDKQKFLAALEDPFSSSASPVDKNKIIVPRSPKSELISKDGFENDSLNSDSKEKTNGSLDSYNYDIFSDLDDDMKLMQNVNLQSQSRKKPPKRNEFQSINGKYFCQFCPDKEFSSKSVWKIHMKNCHKKCNCPCGKYFDTREDYLLHFYQLFPLACFVERKCPERFRSLYFQAVHHRDRHHSGRPFYCVLCFADLENSESRNRACFKDIKSLRIHAEGMGHNPNEMFLISSATEMDSSLLPWSMKCTGIDFC